MFFHFQQLPDCGFFRMFRAGRVARCRTDALVVFADQLFVAEVLVRRIAPVDFTHTLMEILRKGFRQTVGKRFHHDFVVIIMLCFKGISQCVLFQPASHGKCADVIRFAGNLRRNEVSETVVSEAGFFGLLAQMVADINHMGTRFVTVDFNVIAHTVCREQAHHTTRVQHFFGA
ncbi:hypothetical protein ExPUPEC119_02276 [Escherichia coli]|nr:hypothetical protein ExPUPEC119_02276 [Escherichia coli]